jgi:hypothetical protein
MCELINTGSRTEQWRVIISKIREVYSGTLTDSANWGGHETKIKHWDDVDIIGVDAYYPIDTHLSKNPTVEELVDAW